MIAILQVIVVNYKNEKDSYRRPDMCFQITCGGRENKTTFRRNEQYDTFERSERK